MIYVISDIHGCFEEFKSLLKQIHFSSSDELYLLGDFIDRGPEPIKLIQFIMLYPNIYPILGNHEYMAMKILSKLDLEITENTVDILTTNDIQGYLYWMQDGGEQTANQFRKLDKEDREDILDYLNECSLYEDLYRNGNRFVLVHAGINNFDENKPLYIYEPEDFIFIRPDYEKRYFSDEHTYLLTGHTPTFCIREDRKKIVFEQNGHIAIDCGCVFGGMLAAFCLDTGESFYVEGKVYA